MKKVIVVRHGYYRGVDLHDIGRQQIRELGNLIKASVYGGTTQLFSSTAPRAAQSADILSEILGVGVELHDFLWSGPDGPEGCRTNLSKTLDLCKQSSADVIILVTHLEFTERFPKFFAEEMLNMTPGFPEQEIRKGEAWVIDCEAKTCTRLETPYS